MDNSISIIKLSSQIIKTKRKQIESRTDLFLRIVFVFILG